jgi:chitinase
VPVFLRSGLSWASAVLIASLLPAAARVPAPAPTPASKAHSKRRAHTQGFGRQRLVGYFPQWGLYNQPQYVVKNLVVSGGAAMLDQLNYAQGFVTNGHCSIADPNADLNYTFPAAQSVNGKADSPTKPFRGNLHQLVELKRRYPRLKILISLEGKGADFAQDAQPENRQAFINSCVDLFLKGNLAPGISAPHLFDGIDVDWEYPHAPDAANFLALLTGLRRQMDALRPGLILSVATGPTPHMYEGTDMGAVARIVDQVGLMTYDFNGPWSPTTGFVAPLASDIPDHIGSVEHTVASYMEAGVPAAKLLIGIPFYGYGWHQVPEIANGLNQEGTAIHGDRPYSYIQTLAASSTIYRDPISKAPWLFDGDTFWTFDDPASIRAKATFARSQHVAGLMLWELGEDTTEATLLSAAHKALRGVPSPEPPADTTTETSTSDLPPDPAQPRSLPSP